MELNATAKPLIADGSIENHDFTIEAEDSAHIISMLSDKLYSDKVLAVVREYMANAFDANVEAGSSKPIEVHVPNQMDPNFRVRDYGLGLSKENILNVFIKMGKSTKRSSNDQVGAFGIGGKSFRAYGDAMNITSVHGGTKTFYTAQKTPNGGNRLFVIQAIPSDEPNGITIEIPVNPKDFNEFEEKILNLSSFFEVTPAVSGTDREVKPVKKSFSGNGWYSSRENGGKPRCLMGNIPYAFDVWEVLGRNASYNDKSYRIFSNSSFGFVFNAKIGEVDISPDREKLELTPKTKLFIKKKAEQIADEYAVQYKKSMENAETLTDALDLYFNHPAFIDSKDIEDAKWKGHPLSNHVLNLKDINKKVINPNIADETAWTLYKFEVDGLRYFPEAGIRRRNYGSTISFNSGTIVFLDPYTSRGNMRAKKIIQDSFPDISNMSSSSYSFPYSLVRIKGDKEGLKKIYDYIGGSDMSSLVFWVDDVEPPKQTLKKYGSSSHIKTFVYTPHYWNGRHQNWKGVDTPKDNEKRFYVPISRFSWTQDSECRLISAIDFFDQVHGEKITLYGVRTADAKKLDKNWVNFWDYAKEKIKLWHKNLDKKLLVGTTKYDYEFYQTINDAISSDNTSEIIKDYIASVKKVRRVADQKDFKQMKSFINRFGNCLRLTIEEAPSLREEEKAIENAYSMLRDLMVSINHYSDKKEKIISRYIKLEDQARKALTQTQV